MITTTLNRIKHQSDAIRQTKKEGALYPLHIEYGDAVWGNLLRYLGKTDADGEPLQFIDIKNALCLHAAEWCLKYALETRWLENEGRFVTIHCPQSIPEHIATWDYYFEWRITHRDNYPDYAAIRKNRLTKDGSLAWRKMMEQLDIAHEREFVRLTSED